MVFLEDSEGRRMFWRRRNQDLGRKLTRDRVKRKRKREGMGKEAVEGKKQKNWRNEIGRIKSRWDDVTQEEFRDQQKERKGGPGHTENSTLIER